MFSRILGYLKEYWKFYFFVILFILTFFIWYTALSSRNHNLKIAFLDIGQGDAIFIQSPDGNQIIFDGGPGDALMRELPKHMGFFDRSIDMMVVTNPDKDHFEGFIPLLDKYEVEAFVSPGVNASENPLYQELLKNVTKEKSANIVARHGQKIDLGGGVYIEIFFPDRDVPNISHNDGSIIARLVYGKTKIMLTGDTTINIEKYLVNKGLDLDSDILKIAHHGSKTSTSPEFVKAVSPEVAIISASKDNLYGHPHKETLDTLTKEKVPVLGTYNEGTIVFESDGEKIWRR